MERATTKREPERPAVAAMTKEIVILTLAIDSKTGAVLPDAPFLVAAHHSGLYEKWPEVISQIFCPARSRPALRPNGWIKDGSLVSVLQTGECLGPGRETEARARDGAGWPTGGQSSALRAL